MEESIECYFPLIESICYKYGAYNGEPVRDRIEFSVACEAYLESARKWDPSNVIYMPQEVYFEYFIALRIRQRLLDYRRKVIRDGKRHAKATEAAKTKPLSEMNKQLDKIDLYEIILGLGDLERVAAVHYLNTGLVPTDNLQRAWYRVKDKIGRMYGSAT